MEKINENFKSINTCEWGKKNRQRRQCVCVDMCSFLACFSIYLHNKKKRLHGFVALSLCYFSIPFIISLATNFVFLLLSSMLFDCISWASVNASAYRNCRLWEAHVGKRDNLLSATLHLMNRSMRTVLIFSRIRFEAKHPAGHFKAG